MGVVKFIFKEEEKQDINLCVRRDDMICALYEVAELVRMLYNRKTYSTKYLYPIEAGKDEFGRDEVSVWSTQSPYEDCDSTEFVEVDYIVGKLNESLEDVRDLLH